MTTITRSDFVHAFVGQPIDTTDVDPRLTRALAHAGVDTSELAALAGDDGVIEGGDEFDALFSALDDADRDGSRHSLVTDRGGVSSPAGDAIDALFVEADRQRQGQPMRVGTIGTPASVDSPADAWLDVARGELGQQEISGQGHNPRILEYHASTSLHATTDETPWCASFVNWVLDQAGIEGTHRATALSFKNWGSPSDVPVMGALAVIDYGGGKGHVGFVVGRDGKDLVILGGNQQDGVRYTRIPESRISEFRLPPGHTPGPADAELPRMHVGRGGLSLANTR